MKSPVSIQIGTEKVPGFRQETGMSDSAVLVTGAAGFIGFHVAQRLLRDGRTVVGLDIVNEYYDPALKEARLEILQRDARFSLVRIDLTDRASIKSLFAQYRFPV